MWGGEGLHLPQFIDQLSADHVHGNPCSPPINPPFPHHPTRSYSGGGVVILTF